MSNQYTVAPGAYGSAVLAPDGLTQRSYLVGDDAATLADCLRLATDEAARLNNVGVTYRLEKWCPKTVDMDSHWASNFIYTDVVAALKHGDESSADGSLWRVVRQTREVLL